MVQGNCSIFKLIISSSLTNVTVKVTVQFETEGNGENEIVGRMDRSEVKF